MPATSDVTGVMVDVDALERFVGVALERLEFSTDDAATAARVMARTEARGIKTHGTYHLGGLYLAQLRAGGIDPHARPTIERETPATAVIDGHGGLGQIAAAQATELAAAKARSVGCATVVVRNTNHTGALGHYALMLAEGGLIGIAAQNTPPAVAPPGAAAAVIGNQPTAFGLPDPDGQGAVVLDVAMSTVAASKVGQTRQRGLPIPEGWILDAHGMPTTDAAAPFLLTTMGGLKGYGLSILVEVMTGLLSGGAILSELNMSDHTRPYGMSFWVTACDVAAFMDLEEFKRRLAQLRAEVHAAPTANGAGALMLPGEPEAQAEARARESGIPMDEVNWAPLAALAAELGLSAELVRARR